MSVSLPYQGAVPFCEASRISDPQRLMGADFCPELSPSWEMIAPPFCDHESCIFSFLQAIISRQTRTGRDISSALLALYPLSSIQLPLNLDQIACSGRFSSPHLAKRLSRRKILRTLWKVSSLLMISEMTGFGKSTLALSQLLSSHKVSILVFDLKVGIYHTSISNYLKDSN